MNAVADDSPRAGELRENLRAALSEWGVDDATLADDEASLIRSGALDSVALFNLSMWIEQQLGRPVDPGTVEVAQAWDSVSAVVAFVLADGAPAVGAADAPAPAAVVAASPVPPGYVLRRADEADIGAIARLFTQLWSDDLALNERIYRWKYLSLPGAAESLVYLVCRDGAPVAMRAMAATTWEAGGLAAPATLFSADDFIVEDEHRNQGLYAALQAAMVADLAARGHGRFLSLSALRVTRLQAVSAGSRSVPIGPPVGVAGRWSSTVQRVQDGVARLPGGWRLAGRLDKQDLAERAFAQLDDAKLSAGLCVTAAADVQAMAELVARLPHDGRLRQRRDAAFLAWRLASPLNAYRVVELRRAGRLAAYATLSRSLSARGNRQRINLVDWAAEDDDALRDVLGAALTVTQHADLVTWQDGADARWQRALAERGFAPVDVEQTARGLPCLLVHSVAADHREPQLGDRLLLDAASWDLRMLYTAYG